jgi:hypothetical protein
VLLYCLYIGTYYLFSFLIYLLFALICTVNGLSFLYKEEICVDFGFSVSQIFQNFPSSLASSQCCFTGSNAVESPTTPMEPNFMEYFRTRISPASWDQSIWDYFFTSSSGSDDSNSFTNSPSAQSPSSEQVFISTTYHILDWKQQQSNNLRKRSKQSTNQ